MDQDKKLKIKKLKKNMINTTTYNANCIIMTRTMNLKNFNFTLVRVYISCIPTNAWTSPFGKIDVKVKRRRGVYLLSIV